MERPLRLPLDGSTHTAPHRTPWCAVGQCAGNGQCPAWCPSSCKGFLFSCRFFWLSFDINLLIAFFSSTFFPAQFASNSTKDAGDWQGECCLSTTYLSTALSPRTSHYSSAEFLSSCFAVAEQHRRAHVCGERSWYSSPIDNYCEFFYQGLAETWLYVKHKCIWGYSPQTRRSTELEAGLMVGFFSCSPPHTIRNARIWSVNTKPILHVWCWVFLFIFGIQCPVSVLFF